MKDSYLPSSRLYCQQTYRADGIKTVKERESVKKKRVNPMERKKKSHKLLTVILCIIALIAIVFVAAIVKMLPFHCTPY